MPRALKYCIIACCYFLYRKIVAFRQYTVDYCLSSSRWYFQERERL